MTCTPLTHTLLTYTQLLTYNPPPPKPCCDSQVLTVVWGEGWTITPQTPDLCMPPTQHLTYTPIQLLTCVSPTLLLTCNPCNSQSLSTPTPQLLTCATSAPPPQHPPPPQLLPPLTWVWRSPPASSPCWPRTKWSSWDWSCWWSWCERWSGRRLSPACPFCAPRYCPVQGQAVSVS